MSDGATYEQCCDFSDYDMPTWDPVCFRAAGVTKAITNSFSKSDAITRIQTMKAAGIEVTVVYGFCYFGNNDYYVNRDVDAAIELAKTFAIPMVWVDAELDAAGIVGTIPASYPEQRQAQLRAAVNKVKAAGLNVGIYTAGWWWPSNMNNSTEWSDLPLWHADYGNNDGAKAPVTRVNYGGWTDVTLHQYTSTKPLCGRPNRDWNYIIQAIQEEDEMTPDQLELLVRTAEALAGPGEENNAIRSLINRVAPMSAAPLYTAIQNQQAALTEHEDGHGVAAPPRVITISGPGLTATQED